MISFRDMTFCEDTECARFDNGCFRSLTDQVKKDAGKFGLPISQFILLPDSHPECFKEKQTDI